MTVEFDLSAPEARRFCDAIQPTRRARVEDGELAYVFGTGDEEEPHIEPWPLWIRAIVWAVAVGFSIACWAYLCHFILELALG